MLKTIPKISPGPVGVFLQNLVYSIGNSWSDLDLFYGKFKFCNIGFSVGKSEKKLTILKLLQTVTLN